MDCDAPQFRAALKAGQAGVIDSLWDAYAGRVMGFAVYLTGDRTEAEDLLQDTFVAAYQSRHTYRADGKPVNWLLGIAARRWRDTRRRRRSRPPPTGQYDCEQTASALGQQATGLLTTALDQELQRLPSAQREAFLLVVAQGLSYPEASAVTGTRVGTLKWRVHRAMRHLRQNLFPKEELDHELHRAL